MHDFHGYFMLDFPGPNGVPGLSRSWNFQAKKNPKSTDKSVLLVGLLAVSLLDGDVQVLHDTHRL